MTDGVGGLARRVGELKTVFSTSAAPKRALNRPQQPALPLRPDGTGCASETAQMSDFDEYRAFRDQKQL